MPSSTTAARRGRARPAGVPSPWGMFLRGFVKHPVMVGSIIPSSDRLIRQACWGRSTGPNCKLFVEYGPGVGTFCRPDPRPHMAPDATLIAIDTNPDFIRYLDATPSSTRVSQAVRGIGRRRRADRRRSRVRACRLRAVGPPLLDAAGRASAPPSRSATQDGAADRAARSWSISSAPKVRDFIAPHFDADRPRHGMVERAAGAALLGLEGLGSMGRASPATC